MADILTAVEYPQSKFPIRLLRSVQLATLDLTSFVDANLPCCYYHLGYSDIKVAGHHNQTEKSHFISDLFMILMVKYQVY